jgi:hypothetical protein
MEDARSDKLCVDCRAEAPKEESEHTPISAKHGWRLSYTVDAKGRKKMEWRCRECWAIYRAKLRPKVDVFTPEDIPGLSRRAPRG